MLLSSSHPPTFTTGISDYRELRRAELAYVDRTAFVAAVLDQGARAKLFTRPRRFGKTLNMSTARWFLERGNEDLTDLFQDTWIWSAEQGRHREHFQRYPVLWLSFKDVKARTWDDAWFDIRRLLVKEFRRLASHLELRLDRDSDFDAVQRFGNEEGGPAEFRDFLERVPRWCAGELGEPCVILIDEYDTPLITAWEHGYGDDAVAFFRAFLPAGLKDTPHVRAAAMTGILRVARESLFSGLNHVAVHSVLSPRYGNLFGFTEEDVEQLLRAVPTGDAGTGFRSWYNGYRIWDGFAAGQTPTALTLYNPWSVLSYLQHPSAGLRPHWVNTGEHSLLRRLLLQQAGEVGPDIRNLLAGGTIKRLVEDHVALHQLASSPSALWHLLLYTGYLTVESLHHDEEGTHAELCIPNLEVRSAFRSLFRTILDDATTGSASIAPLTDALLSGDGETFGLILEQLLGTMLSWHDVANVARHPVEAVYQAFVVGLLVHLDRTHLVRSNREAGHGRADVLVIPRSPGSGAVLELKSLNDRRGEQVDQALDSAVEQLRVKAYAMEVLAAGATTVHQLVVVFDGKRCWVRAPFG